MSGEASNLDRPTRGVLAWLLVAALALIVAGVLLHTSGLDMLWILRVHERAAQPLSVLLWSCITVLGLGAAAVIIVLAADRGSGRIAALLLPTFVLGAVLTRLPKWALAAPRPAASSIGSQLHVIGQTYAGPVSMPSGHALTAGAATLLVCVALGRRQPFAIGLLVLAGATVAWSRVVVGAHWPSDVFVGAGLGILAVWLVLGALKWPRVRRAYDALARRIRTKGGQLVVAALELVAVAALLTERTGYPAAWPMVMLLVAVAVSSALMRCRFVLAAQGTAPVERT